MAELSLENATLTAPFAGVIASVSAKVGEIVGATPIVEILNTDLFEVIITVDEIDVANVAVGQTVDVLVDAIGAPALQGTVVRISPQAESDRGVVSYQVTVEVTPDDRPIKSGMTASADIITAQANDVVAVPRSAVRTVDGVSTVVVVANGQREERTVTTGIRNSEVVEIRSGLTAGEVVEVTTGGE
jgi:RND family efflux transporter MFP subunit